ncbi:MAG: P-loop NTPase fold protein, partial [Chromatiales bacterium]
PVEGGPAADEKKTAKKRTVRVKAGTGSAAATEPPDVEGGFSESGITPPPPDATKAPPRRKARKKAASKSKAAPSDASPEVAPDIGELANVRGEFARISELVALQLPGGSPQFSETVAATLERSTGLTTLFATDGAAVVDPAAYLRAALALGMEPERKEKRDWINVHEFLAGMLSAGSLPLAAAIAVPELKIAPERAGAAKAAAVAHPELTEILAHAAEIAGRTTRRGRRIDARHVLAALLLEPAGRVAFHRLDLIPEEPAPFFHRLRDDLMEHILRQAWSGEHKKGWLEVLKGAEGLDLPPGTAPTPVTRYLTEYAPDSPQEEADALGIMRDVRAFSELICLKEMRPPLSIGLFGDWGSGKSFFMDKLERDIARLAEDESERPTGVFVENVVQIRFNAWHYADANLWASLTSEFFDQLRVGGYRGKEGAVYGHLVKEVASRVADAEEEAEKLATRGTRLDGEIGTRRKELAQAEKQRRRLPETVLKSSAGAFVNDFLRTHRAEVAAAARALGLDEAVASDPNRLRQEARKAAELPGKLGLIQRGLAGALRFRDWRAGVFLYGALALGAAASVLAAIDPGALAGRMTESATAFGGLALLIGGLWKVFKTASPIIAAGASYLADVRAKERELDGRLAAAREDLTRLTAERVRVEAEQATRRAFLDRYAPGAAGDSPAALLQYFLHESEDARQFEEHVGLVSRVRRAFETLDSLMEKQRKGESEARGLPTLDRIVLYIDDLDRCRDEQVVQVLEAVHLLLAFDLFVVVVGVDARWLEQSLARFYREQLSARSARQEGKAGVLDYLEKIFQIPLWLRPLDFTDGGSYGRLVDDLVGSEVLRTEGAAPEREEPEAEGAEGGATRIHPVEISLPEIPEEAPEETRKRVQLTEEEVGLIKALGPVAGKSPRAVKRYVNLYRLIRARKRGADLERFLNGTAETGPEYPAVLLLLAVDVGLDPRQAGGFAAAVRELDPEKRFAELYGELGPAVTELAAARHTPITRKLAAFWGPFTREDRNAVVGALREADQSMGGPRTLGSLQVQMDEVMRYSFRRAG